MTSTVRLTAITLENFKNVLHGTVRLSHPRQHQPGSVLGLFGQNGSGKTALLNAIGILGQCLAGAALPERLCDSVTAGKDFARLAFEFLISSKEDSDAPATVFYEFKIGGAAAARDPLSGMPVSAAALSATVYDEKLSATLPGTNGKPRQSVIMDCSGGEPFTPVMKCKQLLGPDSGSRKALAGFKAVALAERKSFVFSHRLSQALQKQVEALESRKENSAELALCRKVQAFLSRLRCYAQRELFVIDTAQTGLIDLRALPLLAKCEGTATHPALTDIADSLSLNLNGPSQLPVALLSAIDSLIVRLNRVLTQIVPGLRIKLRHLATELDEQGREIATADLVSLKNEMPISLRYESEGIKKLLSVLPLLICVYNQRSVTVAVDALDTGIFEHLLGELLRLISERGRGQFIFTAHDLRPLETLDKSCIAFTTTDPKNRYTRVKNLKSTNNLRDTYFRELVLAPEAGGLCNAGSNAEIATALREAGRPFATPCEKGDETQ